MVIERTSATTVNHNTIYASDISSLLNFMPVNKNQNFTKLMGDLTKKSSNVVNKIIYEKSLKNEINVLINEKSDRNENMKRKMNNPLVNNKKSKADSKNGYEDKIIRLMESTKSNDNIISKENNDNVGLESQPENKVKLAKPVKKAEKKLKFM